MIKITDELLDEHREINVYDQWHEFVYSDFIDDMKKQGVRVDNIMFSGFWSQGDGACFEGEVEDISKLVDLDEYPMIKMMQGMDKGSIGIFIASNNIVHYYHEHSVDIDIKHDEFYDMMDAPSEVHKHVIKSYDEKLTEEMEGFSKDAVDTLRGCMQQLYRKLEKEYEHLTSDDLVEEAIKANYIGE
jgi:hypothetical protein